MQTEPPVPPDGEAPQGPPMLQALIPLLPVPQTFHVEEGHNGDKPIAILTITSPLTTTVVILDEQAAARLAEQLRGRFAGALTVAGPEALQAIRQADELASRRR